MDADSGDLATTRDGWAEYEQVVRKRIRFWLPLPLAVLLMVGIAAIAADVAATDPIQGLIMGGIWEVVLALAVIRRLRLQTRLNRLLDGRCPACGYDLRATRARCPECGWAPPPTAHGASAN
jgi:hypothetical protein